MKTSGFPRPRLPDSAARNDVRNPVNVDPVDDAGIDISHLEQRWNLWVSGTAIHPDHICHAPSTIRVGDDHRVAWFDVQKKWDPTWALQRRLHGQPTYSCTNTAV